MNRALKGPTGSDIGAGGQGQGSNLGDIQPQAGTLHALGRRLRYVTYRDMYNGNHWLGAPSPGERRLTFNYCRVFVNKAASYLFGKPVGYDVVRGSGEGSAAAAVDVENYLGGVHEFNEVAALDLDMAISAGVLGDGAFTVRWDPAAKMPRITGVDPSALDARWRSDDLRTLLWVRQRYYLSVAELSGEQASKYAHGQLSVAGQSDPYAPLVAQEEWTAERWRLTLAGVEIDGGRNPYKTVPYVIFPNLRMPGEFWGEGDLVDIVEVQRELNWRMSVFTLLLDVMGSPVAVLEGAGPGEGANLKLGPRQLWELPEGVTAKVLDLLSSGGSGAHFSYIDSIYRTMHDISEMPRTSFGDSAGQSSAKSGVALEIELQPLLHKLGRKNLLWSVALVRRAQLALTIARLHGEKLPEARLRVSWPPVLPQDRVALIKQETALVAAGLRPITEAMQFLGEDDPDGALQQVIADAKKFIDAGLAGPLAGVPPLAVSTEGEVVEETGNG